jgi:hypothetical protein
MVALYSLHTYLEHMGQEAGAQKEATDVFVANIQTNSVPVANVTFAKNYAIGIISGKIYLIPSFPKCGPPYGPLIYMLAASVCL